MKSWADYAASFLFSPSTKGARTELVDLLAVQRVADLNVRSRVVLLDALQQMPLSACPRRGELWVRNVMLWTRGDELTELKTLCDLKGDVHSLHKLVYQDIRESSIRTDILKHVQREASVQSAHRLLRTRKVLGAIEALEKFYLIWTTRCCVRWSLSCWTGQTMA